MVKDLISMSWRQYVVDVVLKCAVVALLAGLLTAIARRVISETGLLTSIVIMIIGLLCTIVVILLVGMNKAERDYLRLLLIRFRGSK